MSEKGVSNTRRMLFTVIVTVFIAVLLIAVIGYAAFIFISGSGEASQDISEVVQPLDGGENVYRIDPGQSTARFYIDEVLNGQDKTVIGETNQVGAQMAVNFEQPAETEIGEIVINARTFQTDDDNRNRAIRTFILQSNQDQYEFITFAPTDIIIDEQSNQEIVPGTVLQVSITGDLTVVDATREVTFTGEITYNSDDTISGLLDTTIRYADFDLSIQAPPIVSDISEEVRLELEFVAIPADGAAATDDADEAESAEDEAAEDEADTADEPEEEAPPPDATEEAE